MYYKVKYILPVFLMAIVVGCGSDDNINEAIIGRWAEESSVSSSEYVYEFKSDGSGNYMVKSEKGTDVIPIHYVITEASNGKYTYLLQIVYDRKNGIEEGHQSWMNIDSDRMFLYKWAQRGTFAPLWTVTGTSTWV